LEDPHENSYLVSDAAAQWLAIYVPTTRSPKNSLMAAQRVRDYLAPYMGARQLSQLRPDDLRAYRLWLQNKGLALRTVRHLLADARCLLSWCVEAESINRSPFPRRVMPRIQEEPPDRLEDHEVRAVLGIPEPQAFVVRLALGTGLRWGEMCRARAEHLEGDMLRVAHTKSGRIRRVPLAPELRDEIRPKVAELVPYGDESQGAFAKFARRHSRVRTFHVHQLRHTYACRWIENGGSLPALQQVLGHASVVTTQMYARLSDENVRREAATVLSNRRAS
jgi:integrase